MLKTEAYAIHASLPPCPFCGNQLTANIRGGGDNAPNPKASCKTAGCYGGRLPVLCLDIPEDVAAWGQRAAQVGQQWPATRAETLLHVIQCLNQNPYNLTKSECITLIREMREASTQPAPAPAPDALREAEAALEVAIARILKADPGHSISVTSEAKALVAVRAALAATPAARFDAGNPGNKAAAPVNCDSLEQLNENKGLAPAAAPVVLPEPDDRAEFKSDWLRRHYPLPMNTRMRDDLRYGDHIIQGQFEAWNAGRALLAGVSAPAAQAEIAKVDLPDVEDMAHSALEEALSGGLGHFVMHKWMRSVMDKTVAAMKKAAPQVQADARDAAPAASEQDALSSAGWVRVETALPEYSLSEVLILQMYFEPDGTARMHDKENPSLGYLYNIAKGHCHQDSPVPRWAGRSGNDFGLKLNKPEWRVVAWRHIHPANEYVAAIAAQTAQQTQGGE